MDFQKKDDIFTNNLLYSDLIFTQYLYIKDEVRLSLLVCILNKSDNALFWAYELYNSGFKYELFNLIWKIYFDFFATLNTSYEAHLFQNYKEYLNENTLNDEHLIGSIVTDMLFRPFNTDVFMLRNLCDNFEIDISFSCGEQINSAKELFDNMLVWISNDDYRSISQWILNINRNSINVIDIYDICLEIFENTLKILTAEKKHKLKQEFRKIIQINVNSDVILLTKILQLFSNKAKLKKGKSIYIDVQSDEIEKYRPKEASNNLKHYNILKNIGDKSIDEFQHLGLFKLTRDKYNIKNVYYNKWLYYASFSPLWAKRIHNFKGCLNNEKQDVIFDEEPNDDLMQLFYGKYGLEPDEQPINIYQSHIGLIEKKYSWNWFYNKYKNNGLLEVYEEELEEFDVIGLTY